MFIDEMIRLVSLDLPPESVCRPYSTLIHRYSDLTEVMVFIESLRHEQILFIVSDRLAEEALSQMKLYRHVRDLFILNCSPKPLKIDLERSRSAVEIFHSENKLHEAVETRVVSMEKNSLCLSPSSIKRNERAKISTTNSILSSGIRSYFTP